MSDAKAQGEPSMEEILATISRLIEQEVFDLTEAVGADGSVRHLSPRVAGEAGLR